MSDTTSRDGRGEGGDGIDPSDGSESTVLHGTEDHGGDGGTPTQQMPVQDGPGAEAPRDDADDWQRSWDEAGGGDIEPTVIAPSTLRGPSHDADDEHGDGEHAIATAPQHDEATVAAIDSSRSVEAGGAPAPDGGAAHEHHGASDHHDADERKDARDGHDARERNDAHDEPVRAEEPPALVEPRRPSLSLRGEQRPDLADTAPFAGLAAAGAVGAAAGAGAAGARTETAGAAQSDDRTRAMRAQGDDRTQAMPAQPDDRTQAMPAQADERTQAMPATTRDDEPRFEVDEPRDDQRTERVGSIAVDDATARAAATGTPIVLVESSTPPRKRGARGVGFLVVLVSTIVFGALLAAVLMLVTYLFESSFVLQDELQTIWLRPAWLVPVAVFFVAYWLTTIIVNRAGWWAHVLGGFLVALLATAGHVVGAFLETQSNVWDVLAITSIGGADLGRLLLAPTTIATFVLAREVPIWFGGIVARRGRRAKERNRTAQEEYDAEQARRLEEYEATRA